MAITDLIPGTTGNMFLDSLDQVSMSAVLACAEEVDATASTVLTPAREEIKYAVFPLTCAISIVTRMKDGSDVEAMLVGREGFYGLQLALGRIGVSSNEAIVQLPGRMLRIATADFVHCMQTLPEFAERALSYAYATLESIAQLSACNRLHPINERAARWLLMAHDRVAGDTVLITHEFLATMLGVRRPGVSLATAVLDQSGYIETHRGRITIRNRPGLESVACECYAVMNAICNRIVGYDARKAK
jgi:CRP-like cAMP-binding protein